MQITHEEAHKLIQFNADQTLNAHEKTVLSTHLEDCNECRSYAKEIREVESILLPLMQRHWNRQPLPLPIRDITSKKTSRVPASIILITRIASIGIFFIAFIFSVWQFSFSNRPAFNPWPAGILPIQTPSMQTTSTQLILQNCDEKLYVVRENDTLESIAYQFSVPKEEIMAINNMSAETVNRGMELIVPICNSTPTGTAEVPATLTRTYTPSIILTTFTPNQ